MLISFYGQLLIPSRKKKLYKYSSLEWVQNSDIILSKHIRLVLRVCFIRDVVGTRLCALDTVKLAITSKYKTGCLSVLFMGAEKLEPIMAVFACTDAQQET